MALIQIRNCPRQRVSRAHWSRDREPSYNQEGYCDAMAAGMSYRIPCTVQHPRQLLTTPESAVYEDFRVTIRFLPQPAGDDGRETSIFSAGGVHNWPG